jgi:hypothetical protein
MAHHRKLDVLGVRRRTDTDQAQNAPNNQKR